MTEPDEAILDGEAGPALPDSIRRHLGALLRSAYEEDGVREPDRFAELLVRLDKAMGRSTGLGGRGRGGLSHGPARQRAGPAALRPVARPGAGRRRRPRAGRPPQGLAGRGGFEPGTNLEAWLFTILRNVFYSRHRRQTREVSDSDGDYAGRLAAAPEQGGHLDLQDVRAALDRLAPVMREALVLVGIENLSYEEAAAVMECQIGTAKSRVWRARAQLARMLGYGGADIGSDGVTLSALGTVSDASG